MIFASGMLVACVVQPENDDDLCVEVCQRWGLRLAFAVRFLSVGLGQRLHLGGNPLTRGPIQKIVVVARVMSQRRRVADDRVHGVLERVL